MARRRTPPAGGPQGTGAHSGAWKEDFWHGVGTEYEKDGRTVRKHQAGEGVPDGRWTYKGWGDGTCGENNKYDCAELPM